MKSKIRRRRGGAAYSATVFCEATQTTIELRRRGERQVELAIDGKPMVALLDESDMLALEGAVSALTIALRGERMKREGRAS